MLETCLPLFFKSEFYTYKGEWQAGLKHGRGEMIYPNGDKVQATWDEGRIDGEGILINKGGRQTEAIWYKDIMIPLGS
jgi:hypothetical protein